MKMTQDQYDLLAKNIQLIEFGSEDEWEDLYLDTDSTDVTTTNDTIADLKNNTWNEASGLEEETHNGMTTLRWESVQGQKGAERRPLTIVDFGEFRAIYH
ncbi:MAG: hypothetical protein ACPG32_04385 [Akkermansiaceae bacterium]